MDKKKVNELIQILDNVDETINNTIKYYLQEHKNAFVDKIVVEDDEYVLTDERLTPNNYVFIEVEYPYSSTLEQVRAIGIEMDENNDIYVYGMNEDGEIKTYAYTDVAFNDYRNLLTILTEGEYYDVPSL